MDLELEAAQRVGTTLCNKWKLERLIGTGGMAAVYEAAHKIGRRDAIKILHADVARDPDLRARFEQEAHAVNRFKHPGAVEIRDIDVTEDGAPFLVMELLEGEPLAELARRPGGVELDVLLRLTDELLDVLAAAHAQGIIHRDIKPDNLFVLKDGRLKVLDFGIARVRAAVPAQPSASTRRTRAGMTLGTAPYMPPEQIKGHEIDARADLFAVGATLFRLLARRRVHEAATEAETLVKMASEPAPPLASVAPEVPRDVGLVVDRALMFDRSQRYPDATTMQRDVRALRAGQPPPYAHARLLEGTPAPSALRPPTLLAAVSSPGALEGPAPPRAPLTAASPDRDLVALGRTKPASPSALHLVVPALAPEAGAAPAASSRKPTPEPSTRTMTPVGAPDEPPSSGSLEQSLTQTPAIPLVTSRRVPGAERTLRSEHSPDGGAPPRAAGYIVATRAVLPPARPAGASPGPRTVPAGTEPLPPDSLPESLLGRPGAGPLPGASIPVVQPSRYRTLTGSEPHVGLLVLVGVLFAALGVGLTLWFMLRGTAHPANANATATASAEPQEPAGVGPAFPGIHQRPHSSSLPHASSSPHAAPPPALDGGAGPHGKGHRN